MKTKINKAFLIFPSRRRKMRPSTACTARRRTESVERKCLLRSDGQVCCVPARTRMTNDIPIISSLIVVLSYKCGNYAQFKDSDENLYDSITLTCQWNRAWSRDLDECSCANDLRAFDLFPRCVHALVFLCRVTLPHCSGSSLGIKSGVSSPKWVIPPHDNE